MQYIIPCTVARPLAVFKDFFDQGIIKKSLDKIAALFAVLVFSKKGGDFNYMVFQGIVGTEQFRLFAVLMVIRDFGMGVKVVVADFQPRGACRRPVNGGLRRFLPGRGSVAYTSV